MYGDKNRRLFRALYGVEKEYAIKCMDMKNVRHLALLNTRCTFYGQSSQDFEDAIQKFVSEIKVEREREREREENK